MYQSTFRRLEVFVAVVDAGSFAAGAQRLGISQPAVSDHVRGLERHFGCALFARRRGASPAVTEMGRRLYDRALGLLGEMEQLSLDLGRDRLAAPRRSVTVAPQRYIANLLLCAPLADFARDHPGIDLVAEPGVFEEVMQRVRDGVADIGYFLSLGPVLDLASEPVGRERLGFFAAPEHPLATRRRIAPQELNAHAFVTAHQESHFSRMVQNLLAPLGIAGYRVSHQARDGALIKELVLRNLGITCAFARGVAAEVASGRLVALPVTVPPLSVEIRQALTPRRPASRATLGLASYLRGVFDQNLTGTKRSV